MADRLIRVELTASFLERLNALDAFLAKAGADIRFDLLLDDLRSIVIPNLARFPRIGRHYLDSTPRSAEALSLLTSLPAGAPDALREHSHGDYLLLYTLANVKPPLQLLSIRHHRELSFDFAHLWPGASAPLSS